MVRNRVAGFSCTHIKVPEKEPGFMLKVITNPALYTESIKIGVRTRDGHAKDQVDYFEVKDHEVAAGYTEQYVPISLIPKPTKKKLFSKRDLGDDLEFYAELVDLTTKEKEALEGFDTRVKISILKDGYLEGEEQKT